MAPDWRYDQSRPLHPGPAAGEPARSRPRAPDWRDGRPRDAGRPAQLGRAGAGPRRRGPARRPALVVARPPGRLPGHRHRPDGDRRTRRRSCSSPTTPSSCWSLAGLGLLAGLAAAWFLRRRRGVATLLALAIGATAAWRSSPGSSASCSVPAPTEAELADVGAVVTDARWRSARRRRSRSAPFAALLAYLVPVVTARQRRPRPDRGRPGRPAGRPAAAAPTSADPRTSARAARALDGA